MVNHLILLEKGKQLLVSHVKGNPPILYLCLLSVDDFRIEPPTFEKNWICTYLLCANTGLGFNGVVIDLQHHFKTYPNFQNLPKFTTKI